MNPSRPIQVIAVTSGKGGVGKTQLSVNLGMALAEMQRRVVLLDGDFGLGNTAITSGVNPDKTIADVIAGKGSLQDVLVDGPGGMRLVPAASGSQKMAGLSPQQHAAIIHGFAALGDQLDVLLVDTATGVGDAVVNLVCASREVLVVICNEPASIMDAYALIKLLSEERGLFRFRVVANMARNAQEGKAAFAALNTACDESLDVALLYLGHIPYDDNIRLAAQKRKPLLEVAPRCRATQAIRGLAEKLDRLPSHGEPSGHLEFFVEQLLQANR